MAKHTQLEFIQLMLEDFKAPLESHADTIRHLLGSNQNPGCGGDGKMSVEQWTALKQIEKGLCTVQQGFVLLGCAKATPQLCESAGWHSVAKPWAVEIVAYDDPAPYYLTNDYGSYYLCDTQEEAQQVADNFLKDHGAENKAKPVLADLEKPQKEPLSDVEMETHGEEPSDALLVQQYLQGKICKFCHRRQIKGNPYDQSCGGPRCITF